MEGGYRETSPLIQAALRGNTETAEVLLRAGADVNSRAGGFTAAGRLLMVLKTESRLREQRLDMLRFLLNNGSDINAPFYRISMRPKDNKRNLLDEALMNGDNDVVTTFRELLSIDVEAQPTMTLSGIISCAKRGIDALRNYMRKPPSWKSRRHMEAAAMAWCLDRVNVQAVLTMLQAGFDPRLGFQVDVDFFISVYQNSPLTLPSRELALVILGDRLDTGKQADWIKTFLGSSHKDVLRLLFNIVLVSKGWDGTEMMVLAARSGNIAAVSLLHQEYRVEYDGTVEFLNTHCSVLLLSAASFRDTIGNPFGPLTAQKLAKFQPASIEMLGFLVRQGADINTCHPSLWSGQHRIDGEQLKWLIDNSPDRLGVSIYRIMFTFMQVRDFRNPQHDSDVERTILQSLANQYLPVFSEREAISFRHHRNIETDRHPLSFFISLKPGPGFIHQVLESGIDVNGRGKRPGTDTPLRAAARASDFDLVEKLVSLGAKVSDTEHDFGLTALQLACGARVSPEGGITTPQPANRRIAELLLENGADPKATGIFCCVSLLELVEDVVAFELLLDHGENANEVVARCEACSLAYTPCNSMLVLGHNISILQLKVLRYNEEEDPDTKDSLRGIIQVLLRRGARINERETVPDCGKRKPGRSTADMAAALPYMRDDLELLRWLLDAKAELTSSADFEKDTGIHIACSRGNVDFLKLLLDHGVDPNQINNHGDSPLSTAARNGYLAIVLLLLDHGVDPNQINKGGDSPLSTAACNGDLAIVLLLLAAGAGVPIDAQDAQRSPLVRAAEHGHLDIVALLMQLETREEVFEKAIWGAQSCDYVEVASSIEQYLEQRRHSI
jgi:ankyrin repeat protein